MLRNCHCHFRQQKKGKIEVEKKKTDKKYKNTKKKLMRSRLARANSTILVRSIIFALQRYNEFRLIYMKFSRACKCDVIAIISILYKLNDENARARILMNQHAVRDSSPYMPTIKASATNQTISKTEKKKRGKKKSKSREKYIYSILID